MILPDSQTPIFKSHISNIAIRKRSFPGCRHKAANHFGGIRGMPSTFVPDRQGRLVFQHVGQLDQTGLDEQVTPLLPCALTAVGKHTGSV